MSFILFFRQRNTSWTTSSGQWMPLWSGHNLKEGRSRRRLRTSTTQRSLRSWAVGGNSWPMRPECLTSRKRRDWEFCTRKSIRIINISRKRSLSQEAVWVACHPCLQFITTTTRLLQQPCHRRQLLSMSARSQRMSLRQRTWQQPRPQQFTSRRRRSRQKYWPPIQRLSPPWTPIS